MGISSNYDIEDTAAALISAGEKVLNVSGVANVTVDAPETGTNVNAADGTFAFTADVGFDVVDNAGALIAQMDGGNSAGHLTEATTITVNDGTGSSVVNASIGGDLAGFTADVEFDVVDTANLVAAEVSRKDYGVGGFREANNLTVSGGNVDVADAADIQAISG